MPKKITTYVTLLSFMYLVGCYTFEPISYDEFQTFNLNEINSDEIHFITYDSTVYVLDKQTIQVEQESLYVKGLRLYQEQSIPFEGRIAVTDIESVELETINGTRTGLLILTVGTLVLLAAVSTKEKKVDSKGCENSMPSAKY